MIASAPITATPFAHPPTGTFIPIGAAIHCWTFRQLNYFLSLTSVNSASTTSSFGADPPPACAPASPPAALPAEAAAASDCAACFERRDLRLDRVLVLALHDLFQVRQRRLRSRRSAPGDLAAVLLDRRARGVHELIGLVARADEFVEFLVVFLVRFGVAHHALDLFLVQARAGLDLDALFLAGLLVLGATRAGCRSRRCRT